ncbi:hypothetical protein [Flavobacterium sp.]|uniref:hypothetical protein n=1 Tax=Flavobacterium sp. TaxID=239 RepID=UPI0038D14080
MFKVIGVKLKHFFLSFRFFSNQAQKLSYREEVKKETVKLDFDNVFNSIGLAGILYDQLKKRIHPDREKDDQKKELANELAQLISENRRDYNKLLELKKRAELELNICF